MSHRGLDMNDPLVWWEQLRVHGVLELETSGGTPERVAVWLETLESKAYGTLEQVKREPFATVRSALDIQRHWVFWVPREPVAAAVWCDLFYSYIDQKGGLPDDCRPGHPGDQLGDCGIMPPCLCMY
jgi:hypothetical protein